MANITHTNQCESTGARLTQTAIDFYGDALQNEDIDINAGPCHDSFTPSDGESDFESSAFQPLAVDANQRVFLLISRGTLVGEFTLYAQPPVRRGQAPETERPKYVDLLKPGKSQTKDRASR